MPFPPQNQPEAEGQAEPQQGQKEQAQQPPAPMPMGEVTREIQINHELNQEIKDEIKLVKPEVFEGIVEELAQLLQEFKEQLPVFQLLQFTNPEAYQSVLNIVNTLTMLSQLMIQNGDLPTDHDVVSQQTEQDLSQNMQAQGQDDGGDMVGENQQTKSSRSLPIGSVRNNGSGNRARIKTETGWKYISSGYKPQ